MTSEPEKLWQAPRITTVTPKKTAHAAKQVIKRPKRLTGKQQAFIQKYVDNPLAPAYKAVEGVYNVNSQRIAEVIASENLRKPEILAELAKYSNEAEITLIEVMQQSKKEMRIQQARAVDWARQAQVTADSLLDRIHGKSTQRTEVTSQAVTLNIDLTATVDNTDVTGAD